MDTKTYITRSLKYLVWLVLLFTLIFLLMVSTGTSRVDAQQSLSELFGTSRGQLMIAVIVVLAALYPKFGFTKRSLKADMAADRQKIADVFASGGYSLVSEGSSQLVFRASSPVKRALLLWEDTITVTADDNYITLDGIRKEVVKVEFRLRSFLGEQ